MLHHAPLARQLAFITQETCSTGAEALKGGSVSPYLSHPLFLTLVLQILHSLCCRATTPVSVSGPACPTFPLLKSPCYRLKSRYGVTMEWVLHARAHTRTRAAAVGPAHTKDNHNTNTGDGDLLLFFSPA